MLDPRDAWARLESRIHRLASHEVALEECLGRRTTRDLPADTDLPFADVSAMDGYAYAGEQDAGTRMRVAGRIVAGDPPGRELADGTALKIMTGAPVPAGADRVIPIERTDGGQETVVLQDPVAGGANIRRRGEVHRRGELVLPAGTELRAETLGLLASQGHLAIPVTRPPRVAILVTGDEVVPPESRPGPGQLRDSHGTFLRAATRACGAEPHWLGIAGDDRDVLAASLATGLEADCLLVTGGVSMGELDLVEDVLVALGCEILFEKVAIQPGKPLVAAAHPGGLVFGLPGNPASVIVTFRLFVQPALRRLQGHEDGFWHGALRATLAAALPGAKDRDRFLPAELNVADGAPEATPLPGRGSHDVSGYARADALVRIPAHEEPRGAGSPCEVLPL